MDEKKLDPHKNYLGSGKINVTHTRDGRPIILDRTNKGGRGSLVDIPSYAKSGSIGIQYNMPPGTGKRHLAKALKKPLKRRKKTEVSLMNKFAPPRLI